MDLHSSRPIKPDTCRLLVFLLPSLLCLIIALNNVDSIELGEIIANENGNLATNIVNTKIDRTIDLTSQQVKITEKIIIENPTESPLRSYLLAFDKKHADNLAYLKVTLSNAPLNIQQKRTTTAKNGALMTIYEVDLSTKELAAGETLKQPLVVTSIFTNLLKNYPQEIAQHERQLVKYHGYQNVFSPYLTKTQTTKIVLPDGSKVESFSKATKQTTGSGRLTYGPFKDVASVLFASNKVGMEPLEVHYENNSPFVVVTRLQRSIEVSHWAGVVSIENEVDVAHVGAKLKGSFSRYDYQRDHSSGLNSVRSLLTRLPAEARDIYYRDAIGNISTSDVRKTGAGTLVSLRPRFPLFGGWVTNYILGYSLPAEKYLFQSSSSGIEHKLKVPFADLMFENMVVDTGVVKVVLPEGSSNIRLEVPFDYERLDDEVKYSYLDTVGRPVIVMKKLNLVDQHVSGKPFTIYYNHHRVYLLQEPILLTSAIFLLCLTVIIYSRLNFSIGGRPKGSDIGTKSLGKIHKQQQQQHNEKAKNQ